MISFTCFKFSAWKTLHIFTAGKIPFALAANYK